MWWVPFPLFRLFALHVLISVGAAEVPHVALARQDHFLGSRHRDVGTSRVPGAGIFSQKMPTTSLPSENTFVRVYGFCSSRDGLPVCRDAGCCCWSEHAREVDFYPNQAQARFERRCKNAPAGFSFVPEPGFTHSDGQLEALSANVPRFDDRQLCCLVPSNDPVSHSQWGITGP